MYSHDLCATRQKEDNVWLVMDRRTNASRVLTSNAAFVNNHFWNCAEREDGSVIVEVFLTATGTE